MSRPSSSHAHLLALHGAQASSPSSSKFKNIDEYGSLEEAGKKLINQYLIEFTSTRIGVRKEAKARDSSAARRRSR